MELSVVMPIYNTGKYLAESFETILSQTFTDFELICVDDKSTDQLTVNILKEYAAKDSRIHVIRSTMNRGAAVSRNIGLQRAKGEYVIFLDADDFYDSELFGNLIKTMESEEDIDVVYTSILQLDYRNNKKIYIKPDIDIKFQNKTFNIHEIGDEGYIKFWVVPFNKLVRRAFLLKNGIEFQNLNNCNDVIYGFSVLGMANKIKLFDPDEPMIYYRYNTGTQISSNRNPWNLWSAVSYALAIPKLQNCRNQILYYWFLSSFNEIFTCKEECTQKQYYEFVSLLCKYGRLPLPESVKNDIKYKILMIKPENQYEWVVDKKIMYFNELKFSCFNVKSYDKYQKKDIIIWGNGVRSQAIQMFLKEKNNNCCITDIKNNQVGEKTDSGFLIINTKDVKNKSLILASNTHIYDSIKEKYIDVIDMEKYCP